MQLDRCPAERISDIPRHWSRHTPNNVAVFDRDRSVSFSELWGDIEASQRYLSSLGVGSGDRVVIVSENCLAVVALVFALSELTAWPVVVNARLSEREVDVIVEHCRPRVMLFTHAASPDALRHGVRHRAREVAPAGIGSIMLGDIDQTSEREPQEAARDVAALIYTSGTTGQPKGVMVTHRGLLHFARVSAESRNLQNDDCAYAVMPMSHIFGLATLLLGTTYAGGSLYLRARFNAAEVFSALESEAISILQGVPTMFNRIIAYVREHGGSITSERLRYLYTGGGPLDPTLKRDVEALFHLPLHHGYGMTEYAGSLFVTRLDNPRADTSSGEIVEGAELRVVGKNGAPVPAGEPGELWVRGPGVMRAYYRAPDLTAEAFRPDGWLNTGDIGRLGPDGALHIVGRTKDLIIRSGFNVYPIEVESVVNTHPSVRLSAVVGRATGDANEEVIVFVEIKEGEEFDPQAIQHYLIERLAPYKRPERIVRVATIPTTASGKLLKRELREMLADMT